MPPYCFVPSKMKNVLLHRKNLLSKSYYVWPTSLGEGPFIKNAFYLDTFYLMYTRHPHIMVSEVKQNPPRRLLLIYTNKGPQIIQIYILGGCFFWRGSLWPDILYMSLLYDITLAMPDPRAPARALWCAAIDFGGWTVSLWKSNLLGKGRHKGLLKQIALMAVYCVDVVA